jgi:peptidoglycan/xylan/chitin deacetylase (PgdA/CDA1 family)
MTFTEIDRLRSLAPIEIGVHTQTHPVLPFLPVDEQRAEISGCLEVLRERFDDVLPVLAVPYGLFDASTARIARDAGMRASLTLSGTTLARARSPDPLPRFGVTRDELAWKLQLRLSGVAERIRSWRGDDEGEYPLLPSATT